VEDGVRIGLVLSAGGLRGAAHAGVLRALVRHGVPVHAIVGVSAGAVVAAYYAGVGLELDEMIADADALRGRHLWAHSLGVHGGPWIAAHLQSWCGVIPHRLQQLRAADFDRLHHGVKRLGIVCHDLVAGRPRSFGTGCDSGVTLREAVRASASIPALFPPVSVSSHGKTLRLTDGGLSDPVPVAFARQPEMGATHVIVSDCRWLKGNPAPTDPRTVWLCPQIRTTGTLWSRRGLLTTVADGEAAVTPDVLRTIGGWLAEDSPVTAIAASI
jgi:NTE family protein